MKQQDYAVAAKENNYDQMMTNNGEVIEEEESGWTSYFEDLCREKEAETSFCSSSSMVSDASSLPNRPPATAVWNDSTVPYSGNYSTVVRPKRLSFKKRRARGVPGHSNYHDDSLEDTASSPVNSPKVSDLRKMEKNSRRTRCNNDGYNNNSDPFGTPSMGTIKGRSNCLEQQQILRDDDERMMVDFNSNSKHDDCAELKKKGLCLVPLSMLLHYIG